MSLYNLINGVSLATFFILPMLGEKHPDEYPRFRDCFVGGSEENREIELYTRVGGGNRGCDFGEEELYKHPNFLRTEDDDFDNTYATYYFSIPEEWKEDFEKVISGRLSELSGAYQSRLRKVFPKLEAKFDELFGVSEVNEEGKE